MSIGPLERFAYPGVFTRTFFLPGKATSARGAGARYPALIGEVPAQSTSIFEVVRGSGLVAQSITDELAEKPYVGPGFGPAFNGVNSRVKINFWPLANAEVYAKINGLPVTASVVDKNKGILSLGRAPLEGDIVEISYNTTAQDVYAKSTITNFYGDEIRVGQGNVVAVQGANSNWLDQDDRDVNRIADGSHTGTFMNAVSSVSKSYVDANGLSVVVPQLIIKDATTGTELPFKEVIGSEGLVILQKGIYASSPINITVEYFVPVFSSSTDVIPVSGFVSIDALYRDKDGKSVIEQKYYTPSTQVVAGKQYGEVNWENILTTSAPTAIASLQAVAPAYAFEAGPAAARSVPMIAGNYYSISAVAPSELRPASSFDSLSSYRNISALTLNTGSSVDVRLGSANLGDYAGSMVLNLTNYVGGTYTLTKSVAGISITKEAKTLYPLSAPIDGLTVLGYSLSGSKPADIRVDVDNTNTGTKIDNVLYLDGTVLEYKGVLFRVGKAASGSIHSFSEATFGVSDIGNIPVEGIAFNASAIGSLSSGTYTITATKIAGVAVPVGSSYYAKVTYSRPQSAYLKKTCYNLSEVEDYAGMGSALTRLAEAAFANGAPQVAVKPVPEGAYDSDYTAAMEDFLDPMLDDNGSRPCVYAAGSTSTTVHSYIKSWCLEQSNWLYKNEAVYVAGFAPGTKPETAIDFANSGAANTRFVTAVWPPAVKLGAGKVEVGGEVLAAAWAGLTTSKSYDLGTTLTGKSLSGIFYGTSSYRPREEEDLSDSGICVFRRKGSEGLRCGFSVTTDTSDELTREPRITEQAQFYQRELRARLEVFEGQKKLPGLEGRMAESVRSFFKAKKKATEITEVGAISVTENALDPSTYDVEAYYKPMFSVNWILVTLNVTPTI